MRSKLHLGFVGSGDAALLCTGQPSHEAVTVIVVSLVSTHGLQSCEALTEGFPPGYTRRESLQPVATSRFLFKIFIKIIPRFLNLYFGVVALHHSFHLFSGLVFLCSVFREKFPEIAISNGVDERVTHVVMCGSNSLALVGFVHGRALFRSVSVWFDEVLRGARRPVWPASSCGVGWLSPLPGS